MRYLISIHKKLFGLSFTRYIQDQLFALSGVFLNAKEASAHVKKAIVSKHNYFDYYPQQQVTSNKKTHPIVTLLQRIFYTQGIRVTLSDSKKHNKNDSIMLPALQKKADALRNKNTFSLVRDNTSFFTRNMLAQQTDGIVTRQINDWANVVIIEDTVTKIKTAYVYDSSKGLNDAVFMYGLSNHKIICSGILKTTTHRVNDHTKIPQLIFSPHAYATTAKKDAFNHNFLLYAMSLHTPINMGITDHPLAPNVKTGYVYGGFATEELRQETDEKYHEVLEAVRGRRMTL